MRRYSLRDDQWSRIEHLLPGKASDVGVTAADNRLFGEAVLYRYRAGIPWRDLSERFGDFRVIQTGHMRWRETPTMSETMNARGPREWSNAMIDSTIVRATRPAFT